MSRIDQPFFPCQLHQFFGVFNFGGQWLFTDHMLARQQRGFGLGVMQKIRGTNMYGIYRRILQHFLKNIGFFNT